MKQKVWLITGASKGFGRVWTKAALDRGDKVIATARNIGALDDLSKEYGDSVFPVQLDVTDRQNCFEAVNKAISHFGKIDILINNAGFGQFGFMEELTETEIREQMETNFFGSFWMIQAVLPFMRQQKSGHIMQVSSVSGVTAASYLSAYHASKWAVEGLCEALSHEVGQFGIKVTLIEPAGYSTDWITSSAKHTKPMEIYNKLRESWLANRKTIPSGDPNATGEAILKLSDAENPPLRMFLGSVPFTIIEPIYKKRLDTWKEWQKVSEGAQQLKSVTA
jgi:NAD(P)-dependent dehydrogenase (short-subunit alcohol dehydrogenase family)